MFLILGSFIISRIDVTCEPNKGLQYIFNFVPAYGLGYGLIRVRHARLAWDRATLMSLCCSFAHMTSL